MPTKAELQELIDYTTNEWITNYNGTGVNGRKFTGSNGNSIFIPAVGHCYNGSVYSVGIRGEVWSSSLYASDPSYAWGLNFSSANRYMSGRSRYYGRSVRGVMK